MSPTKINVKLLNSLKSIHGLHHTTICDVLQAGV